MKRLESRALLGFALLAIVAPIAASLLACGPTGTGNPPIICDEGILVTEGGNGSLRVTAPAGAVNPPGAQLQITELFGTDPPRIVEVDGDGGFTFDTEPAVLRLQAVLEQERSEDVVDIQAGEGIQSLGDCRTITPSLFLRMTGSAGNESVQRFRATPVCGAPLELSLRRGGQGLTVSGATLDDGDVEVTVRFDGRPSAEDEIVLIAGGEAVWVSVYATAN